MRSYATALFVIALIVVLLIGGWFFFGSRQERPTAVEVSEGDSFSATPVPVSADPIGETRGTGRSLPDFSLTDYQGATVTAADFAGKPLVVNSWAAWCPFCVRELPALGEVQREFGDQVAFVAIDRAESLEVAQSYTDELGLGDTLTLLLDPRDSFYVAIGGFSMPETLFVAADGSIQFHKRGPMEAAEIRQRVQALLNN